MCQCVSMPVNACQEKITAKIACQEKIKVKIACQDVSLQDVCKQMYVHIQMFLEDRNCKTYLEI